MNEKGHKRAPLIVEISNVQDSFRWRELPVILCGGFPQGTFPLFFMEEAYGRVHHICALLCCCAGCLSLLLMLLCQKAGTTLQLCCSRSSASDATIKSCFVERSNIWIHILMILFAHPLRVWLTSAAIYWLNLIFKVHIWTCSLVIVNNPDLCFIMISER